MANTLDDIQDFVHIYIISKTLFIYLFGGGGMDHGRILAWGPPRLVHAVGISSQGY